MPPSNTRKKTRRARWRASCLLPPWASDADSRDTECQTGSRLMTLAPPGKGWSFRGLPSWAWSRVSSPATPPWRIPPPWRRRAPSCYVGNNPRKERLFLSPRQRKAGSGAACASRRAVGVSLGTAAGADPGRPSPERMARPCPREAALDRLTRVDRETAKRVAAGGKARSPSQCGGAACAAGPADWRNQFATPASATARSTHLFV